ncbi:MAG: winged helix-turn-helix transcriptional regulator [Acidobacteria bacterium]|nr:winged helix-turn-helix transcriptional regulator [Acidobacteriota bacterium]
MERLSMDVESRRELTVLDAVARDQHITQRNLAAKLGIALGLTNIYLKRLIRKGYIKCINVQSNRLLYLITPQGIAEKSRLTYEFMDYSLHLYREVRQHLSEVLRPCKDDGAQRIAVYGTGEAAELAYLSLREQGLEPVAIFAAEAGGTFLGMPIRGLDECTTVAFDRLIVATLDKPDPLVAQLVGAGIPSVKLLTLKPAAHAGAHASIDRDTPQDVARA